MFRKPRFNTTGLSVNTSTEADHFHIKIKKMLENKEPIEAMTPLIYTERKEGVIPQYDIRTDRFEIAREARDSITASINAKIKESIEAKKNETKQQTENQNKEGA